MCFVFLIAYSYAFDGMVLGLVVRCPIHADVDGLL